MDKISSIIDNINEWIGKVFGFAVVLIMFIQVMDVILRYVFNSPTIWAWDINAQLFVSSTMLTGGYALLHEDHIKIDLLYGRLNERKKAILDIIVFPLLLLAFALLTWQTGLMALSSWKVKERAFSYFSPPVYPLKTAACIAALLLFLQIISRTYKRILSFRKKSNTGKELN